VSVPLVEVARQLPPRVVANSSSVSFAGLIRVSGNSREYRVDRITARRSLACLLANPSE
jgi:hypothetical protein